MTTKSDPQINAILLIAHGSRHQPANDELVLMADRLRGQGYPIVEPAFLELAEPEIATGGERCVSRGATRILMVPYFLAEGVHMLRDLTAARDALRVKHTNVEVHLGRPLGPDPLLDQLVMERAGQLERDGEVEGLPSAEVMAAKYQPMSPSDKDL